MTSPYHRPLRVGTRGSPLALAQARQVTGQLRDRCGRAAVLIAMATPGDGSAAPIDQLGTTGVFTTTLRAALLRGEVNLVVHSGKDLPTAPVAGLQVAAFPAREDPRDALIWPGGTESRDAASRDADRDRVTAAGGPAARDRAPAADCADARQRRHPAAQAG